MKVFLIGEGGFWWVQDERREEARAERSQQDPHAVLGDAEGVCELSFLVLQTEAETDDRRSSTVVDFQLVSFSL